MLLWRAGGMMLVGMALYRLGVLAAARPAAWYLRMVLARAVCRAASRGCRNRLQDPCWLRLGTGDVRGRAVQLRWIDRRVLAYFALVMLTVKAGRLPGLRNRLAAVGRMALTHVH